MRLVTPERGSRYVLVRVNSNAKTVTIHMLLRSSSHRSRWVVRTIATNRSIKVQVGVTVRKVAKVFLS